MTWTTNHNKTAVHGWVSQPITAYVGRISLQLSVATLTAASGNPVNKILYAQYMLLLPHNIITDSKLLIIIQDSKTGSSHNELVIWLYFHLVALGKTVWPRE